MLADQKLIAERNVTGCKGAGHFVNHMPCGRPMEGWLGKARHEDASRLQNE